MTKLWVVIVDDEPLARSLFKEYLEEYPDVDVVAECGNGFEAVKAVSELTPDLLFLDIEKVRFGDRLSVNWSVDPRCRDCLVPPLLIQPLVENAVTHGIAPLVDGGTVSVEVRANDGGILEIVVDNPYDDERARQKGTGVGIRNVRERLRNLFAESARVDVFQDGRRFRVSLRLPCVRGGTS